MDADLAKIAFLLFETRFYLKNKRNSQVFSKKQSKRANQAVR
ncbi:hypothetical protein [Undibacterium sp. RuTC16W]